MPGKYFMVYIRRSGERHYLVPGGMPLVHYHRGIPVGLQCFKFASLSFFPFGKDVVYGGGTVSFVVNVIWLLVSGWVLALEHFFFGAVLCVTVIGIPFGLQHFKLAKLALMPFGAEVR